MLTGDELNRIAEICKGKTEIKFSVGILKDGKINRYLYGCDGGKLPFKSFVYEIGSITKTFTATLIAKAIADGKLSLEKPLNQYIQGLPEGKIYPIIRRLVTHTAGYPTDEDWLGPEELALFERDFTYNPYDMLDEERLYRIIINREIEAKDYDISYSNIGISILAPVLESIYNKAYDTILQELLKEIGLNDTYLGDRVPDDNLLCGYSKDNVNTGHFFWKKSGRLKAAGYLFSTVDDLLKYAAYQLDDKNDYLKPCFMKQNRTSPDIGICWQLITEKGFAWHNGGTRSFHSFLCIDLVHKNAVTILMNYEDGNIEQLGIDILKRIRNTPVTEL